MTVRRLASVRAGTGLALALAGAALALPGSAAAGYGDGAQLISADFGRLEQGDDTTLYAAISDDARYVAFQTRARNFFADDDPDPPGQYRQGGIFRFDLATRALELVADGNVFDEDDPDTPVSRGALNPSISADGRYVAFSTAQQLTPLDTNGNIDVYVRDMAVPIRALGAYDLVSAPSGGDVPAAYAAAQPPNPGLDPGSELTRGEAISADGTRVAFRSVAGSDLAGPGTPGGQVFMRDRQTNTTTLVTRSTDGGGPAGGAAGPVVLSGDGSTVAWTGGNAAAQTRLLGGENTDGSLTYYLWRRVADGMDSPTRRITGIADVDDPACPAGASIVDDNTTTGPCYGPLGQQEGILGNISSQPPVLSGDGRRVAFLTASAPRGPVGSGTGLDLYSTVMSPGVSRKQGTIELTREAPGGAESSAGIESAAISSDGRFIGLTTVRTRFVLPVLRFTGSARVAARSSELYVIDLGVRTIERAARALGGGEVSSEISSGVSLSADAARVAFTSLAGNLFFGDGNSREDAFVVSRQAETGDAEPLPPLVEDLDGVLVDEGGSSGGPRLGVRARSLRDGRVQLTVRVPGAGELKSQARASARRRGKRGKRSRRKRTLAVATTRPRGAGQTKVTLRVVRRYRRELRRERKLVARTGLTYVAARGGRRLKTSVRVTFRMKAPRKRAKR